MNHSRISIIGGGNLGTAIAHGLLKSKFVKPSDIIVTRRNTSSLQDLAKLGVETTSDNALAIQKGHVIIVALKPYNVLEVLKTLAHTFDPAKHVLVSVVSGVPIASFVAMMPAEMPVFRAMPNTAIAIQESVTCLCHTSAHTDQVQMVTTLFDQLGITIPIDEQLMDAATVLGACGVAFALRFIRAATQGGIEIGFDATKASLIAAQTVKGSAELLLKLNRHPEQEIDKVTTPKGCTITGINEMEHQGFSSSLIRGVVASYDKIRE